MDGEKELGFEKKSFTSIEHSVDDTGEVTSTKLGFVNTLAQKLNAETKGVELITDEEKTDTSLWNAATMWTSANLVVATYALGALGITVFGLSFWQCVLTIIFFNALGVTGVAFFSIFGPKLGLRQILLSKFLVGNVAMRVFAVINIIACVGWGAVNIMSSAQLLNIINDQKCPPWAGCLIIIVGTILVTFFGYHVIHLYEKWSWIPNMVVFIAIIARLAIAKTFTAGHMVGGATTAGSVLSFGGTCFGFATGWTTYASDYTVYQPRNANSYKIFFGVYAGLYFPLIFTMILGAASATGTLTNHRWKELYDDFSIGGLVYAILVEDSLGKFGEFLCVLLALSTIANNVPNMYSIALSAQAFWSPLIKVPRIVWTFVGNFITLAICIPAYYHFAEVVDNFMNMIGYYLAIYQAIALSEHFIYNKGNFGAYDYVNHRDPRSHPLGLAGTFAFCCGVAGAVCGLDQVWYVGPISRKIGEFGGDIGFELAGGFAFVAYNLTRPIEKKYTGR